MEMRSMARSERAESTRTDSPENRVVLAIDQGTSATKAVAVDEHGTIQRRASVPLAQHHPQPGWAEQDPLEIWRSAQQAVRDLLVDIEPSRVVAVGLSTQRESTVIWNRATGEPLGPVLGWQDTRAADLCAQLRAGGHAERVRSITGLPLDAMFSAGKASVLLDQHDPDRSRSRDGELCFGTVDSWLLWQLGGQHLIESGNAARTQLLDITSRKWDPWLLELFNIPIETLPTVVPSIGPFTNCHDLEPLPTSVPVTGVLGDSHAALFAHAGWRPGQIKVTYGTGSSVMGITTSEQDSSAGVARTIAWELDQPTYALEGNIRSSGATLVWLARLFGSTPAQIASSAARDSGGVLLVPAFTGLGAPWWDDQARALISGLSEGTRQEHLARAGLEAIAFQIEDVVAAVEHDSESIKIILADGGPSANAALMQLQADTSGRQVSTSQVSELSALGAAHMAGIGTGLWSLTDLDQLARERTTYRPQSDQQQRQQRQRDWHSAVAAARSRTQQQAGRRD
jgi:glycerol kinase